MKNAIGILALGVFALAGCQSESARSGGASDALAAAGIAGHVANTSAADQDSTPMVVRRVWGGPDVDISGGPSPDGRYLCYVDWNTGNVALRDLSNREARQLTRDGSLDPYESAMDCGFSPDGRHVIYHRWVDHSDCPWELKIVGLSGTEPRVLYRAEDWFGSTWAPDGRHLLLSVGFGYGDARQLVELSVADGATRTMEELGSDWPHYLGGLSYTPDGRYLVYDVPTKERQLQDRDIFVRAVDGGHEAALVRHPADDFVLGWAPDGRHLLFASDRTGTLGAWLLPVEDGRPAGEARLVKPEMWRVWPMGFTRGGSFFYGVNMGSDDVLVATLDPETGQVLAAPTAVDPNDPSFNTAPSWSPDGRLLAYLSSRAPRNYSMCDREFLLIRSVETGETRQLIPKLSGFGSGLWWVDSRSLLVPGTDSDNRSGLFLVDYQTAEAEPLPAFWNVDIRSLIAPSPDGKAVFYRKWVGGEGRLAVMDLETGEETVLFDREPEYGNALSPDGRSLAFAYRTGTTHRLVVMPARGGEPRELYRFEAAAAPVVRAMAWSPDGRYLLYALDAGEAHELWRIRAEGGQPEKLDLTIENMARLRVHPDGRRIAFETRSHGAEVWVMEDFLPATAGTSDEK